MNRVLVSLTTKYLLSPVDCYAIGLRQGEDDVKRKYGDRISALAKTTNAYNVLRAAVESGNVEMLDIVLPKSIRSFQFLVAYAIERKQLSILKKLCAHGLAETTRNLFYLAAGTGDLRIVRWYRSNYGVGKDPEFAYEWAAEGGHLHVMKWIERNVPGVVLRPHAYVRAGNHLAVIRWLKAKGVPLSPYEFTSAIAPYRSLKVLKALHRINPKMRPDWNATINAAELEKVDVLKWLVTELKTPILSVNVCYRAAEMGRIKTLDWLKDNGCVCGGKYHDPKTIKRLKDARSVRIMAELD
ncbi:MAG: hypothetical protein KGL39_10925 [Patescibacteria group bacterium]|nr:hypothetical protein [Patescibacteria group bacterium]